MNALALELLGVAKEYLGPAAPAFLSRELHAMGVNANNVERTHILPLAERALLAAGRVMDNKKASEFAQALAQQGRPVETKVTNDHRLASDAAAKRRCAARSNGAISTATPSRAIAFTRSFFRANAAAPSRSARSAPSRSSSEMSVRARPPYESTSPCLLTSSR